MTIHKCNTIFKQAKKRATFERAAILLFSLKVPGSTVLEINAFYTRSRHT
jgi:hypothetical protein